MAKKDVSSIEKGAGYFLGFITTLMNVTRQKVVPFEAIYRLGTEGGYATVVKIVDIAYTDWQAEQPKPVEQQPQDGHQYSDAQTNGNALPPNHYRVSVTYAPVPFIDALKKEWGANSVSNIFDGRRFQLHSSCADMDRTPGERTFYVHDAGSNWDSEEQIAWGLKQRNSAAPNGYRPATHEEAYEFFMAHPESGDFVSLGSFVWSGGDRWVVRAWQYGSKFVLADDRFDCRWERRTQVLFVRK